MCPSSCNKHITIHPPPPNKRMPPQTQPVCSGDKCMILNCTACDNNQMTITILKEKDLCYLNRTSPGGEYCCQKKRNGSKKQGVPRKCWFADSDRQHKKQKNDDMAGGDDGIVIAISTCGSLIVLLVLAILLVLLIRTVLKKRHEHNLSGIYSVHSCIFTSPFQSESVSYNSPVPLGEGRGYHNRETGNTYTHRFVNNPYFVSESPYNNFIYHKHSVLC